MYQSSLSGELASSHRADLMAAAERYRRDRLVTGDRPGWRRRFVAFATTGGRRRANVPDAPLRLRHAR
jgi:hypothetical protein